MAGCNEKINQLMQISEPDVSKYEEIEAKIRKKREEFSKIRSDAATLGYEKRRLEDTIFPYSVNGSVANCPMCSEEVIVTGSKKLYNKLDTLKAKEAHDKANEKIQQDIDIIVDSISKLNEKLVKTTEIDIIEDKIRQSRIRDMRDYSCAKTDIDVQRREISKLNQKIMEIRYLIKQNNTTLDQIELYKNTQKEWEEKLLVKQQEVLLNQAVKSIFSPTGAPAYIMDSVVEVFNERVQEQVEKVWPNASYSIKTFKENKDKSVKAKFSEELVINGQNCSIGSISGGELTSLSLCVDFALMEVVSNMFGLGCNVVCLDEPFVGLDIAGKEIVMDTLKDLSGKKQIIVIDHASEFKTHFDNVLFIEKRNGTSSLKDSDDDDSCF